MDHILFLTGRLAQPQLEKVLAGLDDAPFSHEVREIGLQVAALMTADMIRRRVEAIDLPVEEALQQDAPTIASAVPNARKLRTITIGMVSLVVLLAYQGLAVTTAMPTVAEALDGMALYAMAFAAPMATGVIGMVAAGIWCDRRGPAGSLRAGVGLFIIGMLLVGFATRMEMVVLGRSVHGLGSGLLLVSLYVVIGRAYPEALRPGVFLAISAAWVVPSMPR